MNWFTQTFSSTIGKKVLVALTGLALVGFLIAHLAGNLLIFAPSGEGRATGMDDYAHALHEIPVLPLAELGLVVFFVLHVGLVLQLWADNRKARGGSYAVSASKRPKGPVARLASGTMIVSGLVVLAFIPLHIWDFRLRRSEVHGPGATEEISALVIETLSSPLHGGFYIVASLLIGWHLFHGIHSAIRSIGFHHPKYTPIIEKVGFALSALLAVGFASIPLAILLGALEAGGN
ncbi:MAG: hypothetical protein EA398_05760 [Deltaproteobacteria bacterium]|nr:MAG: hypothetical protein EA398_05760 [Deltaproteobacteria bacterium]